MKKVLFALMLAIPMAWSFAAFAQEAAPAPAEGGEAKKEEAKKEEGKKEGKKAKKGKKKKEEEAK